MATTLSALTTLSQQRADMVGDVYLSASEWTAYINDSLAEVYGLISQKFGDDYLIATTPYSFTTDGVTRNYPLPGSGALRINGVEVQYAGNPNLWIPVPQFMFSERNGYNPMVFGYYAGYALRHRLVGNSLMLVTPVGQQPAPAGYVIQVWYVPAVTTLVNPTDTIPQAIDGFGWVTSYVSVDTAIKARNKEQSPVQPLMLEKAALVERIESEAANRNAGAPQRAPNPQMADGWWSADDGGGWS